MAVMAGILGLSLLPIIGCSSHAAGTVPNIVLSNGIPMPIMAFAAQVWDADTCHNATVAALSAGFRFIWSSTLVGPQCQQAQHDALLSAKLKRASLFIAGTVNTQNCKDESDCYKNTMKDAEEQMKILSLHGEMLDMLMLDYPSSTGCDAISGQWRALEELYRSLRVRSIAVSNFSPEQLKCVQEQHKFALPVVNQMPFFVGHGNDTVVADNAKYDIKVQAYSPLDAGRLVHDSLCTSIGTRYGKSAVQVALRWIIQRGVAIATQSTSLEHLSKDLDIFDFQLSNEEMIQLNAHSAFQKNAEMII
jgi:diketogulonate reductase-like aldo/keto reductase